MILTEDKYRKIAEVTLTAANESLVAECEGTEMQVALHDALRKVEAQAVKTQGAQADHAAAGEAGFRAAVHGCGDSGTGGLGSTNRLPGRC